MLGWLKSIQTWWRDNGRAASSAPISPAPEPQDRRPEPRDRLERIVLTDGVARTLFHDYAEHRASERGHEEIGWVLLGLRETDRAIAFAAMPAGIARDAGAAHIRFNSDAQALASWIIRQQDRRLRIVGVVHTHPGRLRAPSGGDYQGDSVWVGQLTGGEGVFAIGTADASPGEPAAAHKQVVGDLCFHWYALALGDAGYRPLPVQVMAGQDLALPLRSAWAAIESNPRAVLRMCRLFARVQIEVVDTALAIRISLPEQSQQLRVLCQVGEARYYWEKGGELVAIDPQEPQVDRAVLLILAEMSETIGARPENVTTSQRR